MILITLERKMSVVFEGFGAEKVILFGLFTMYLLTSVQICRYSSWINAGAPNPFLPRRARQAVCPKAIAHMLNRELRG